LLVNVFWTSHLFLLLHVWGGVWPAQPPVRSLVDETLYKSVSPDLLARLKASGLVKDMVEPPGFTAASAFAEKISTNPSSPGRAGDRPDGEAGQCPGGSAGTGGAIDAEVVCGIVDDKPPRERGLSQGSGSREARGAAAAETGDGT